MTFEDILLGLSAFALVVVLWDKFQSKGEMFAEGKKDGIVLDYSKSLLPVLLVVLVVRSFAYEPFRIPSGSMYPTLEIGDFILVEKFTYGLRLPSFYHYGLQWSEPQRGDVVVFRYPNDPSTDFIKRVIALPGDEIQVINRQIYVNGQKADQRVLGEYEGKASGADYRGLTLLEETLPGEDSAHQILNDQNALPRDFYGFKGITKVPQGHYFMMGDNRDHSNDGRYWGFVPRENIKGKALAVWLNWDDGLRFERMGVAIR